MNMNKKNKIIDLIHDFFLIKGHEHFNSYSCVIDSYNSEPGLFNISEKHEIGVVQVYEIMREYRLNELNRNVILKIKETM